MSYSFMAGAKDLKVEGGERGLGRREGKRRSQRVTWGKEGHYSSRRGGDILAFADMWGGGLDGKKKGGKGPAKRRNISKFV